MLLKKRKILSAAVLTALGGIGAANAVQLSTDNAGQVLLYPYYTVRASGNGEYNSVIHLVNTQSVPKAVKVRILEGKNSREVLDFNLYLSAFDEWTAALVRTADGGQLVSSDTSCVFVAGGVDVVGPLPFTNAAYTGIGPLGLGDGGQTVGFDGEDTSLDRTREGYVEIIEMGVITDNDANKGVLGNLTIGQGITHVGGVPADCSVLSGVHANPSQVDTDDFSLPSGGLFGGIALINVLDGSDFGYKAVALDDFFSSPFLDQDIWFPPGDIAPTLINGSTTSNVFFFHQSGVGPVTDVVSDLWTTGAKAVSAVLMRNSVSNIYTLDTATTSTTDWVVTFPTKRDLISSDDPANLDPLDPNGTRPTIPRSPGDFEGPFTSRFWTGGACETIGLVTYNREEDDATTVVEISPPQPGMINQLCWEANVINFNNGVTDSLFGSTNLLSVNASFENGWANLTFTNQFHVLEELGTNSYSGLPVIGFMAEDFINVNVTINGLPSASSYGSNFDHSYTRQISGASVTP